MWTSSETAQIEGYDFVLGSSSPRRQEILRQNLGISNFRVVKSDFEENLPKDCLDVEYVTKTARLKADSILDQLLAPSVLLVADTVVSCGGEIYEKPKDDTEQRKMLENYRRNAVKVITAVHVFRVGQGVEKHVSGCETTELFFDSELKDDALDQYIRCGEGSLAAGGFMYQGKGSMLFSEVQGDFFNVVGLPVRLTKKLVLQAVQEREE